MTKGGRGRGGRKDVCKTKIRQGKQSRQETNFMRRKYEMSNMCPLVVQDRHQVRCIGFSQVHSWYMEGRLIDIDSH